MKFFTIPLLALACTTTALMAQERALLTTPQYNELYTRTLQLMDSTMSAVPGLARAAAPRHGKRPPGRGQPQDRPHPALLASAPGDRPERPRLSRPRRHSPQALPLSHRGQTPVRRNSAKPSSAPKPASPPCSKPRKRRSARPTAITSTATPKPTPASAPPPPANLASSSSATPSPTAGASTNTSPITTSSTAASAARLPPKCSAA